MNIYTVPRRNRIMSPKGAHAPPHLKLTYITLHSKVGRLFNGITNTLISKRRRQEWVREGSVMREAVVQMLFEDERGHKPRNVRGLQKLGNSRKHVPLGPPNARRSC